MHPQIFSAVFQQTVAAKPSDVKKKPEILREWRVLALLPVESGMLPSGNPVGQRVV